MLLLIMMTQVHPTLASKLLPKVLDLVSRCHISGHLPSCYNLGVYYSRIGKSDSKADYYYSKACVSHELTSCINLYLKTYAYTPKESLYKITFFCLQFKNEHSFCHKFYDLSSNRNKIDLESLSEIIHSDSK